MAFVWLQLVHLNASSPRFVKLGVPHSTDLGDLDSLGVATAGDALEALESGRPAVCGALEGIIGLAGLSGLGGGHLSAGFSQAPQPGQALETPDPLEQTLRLMCAATAMQSGDSATLDRLLRGAAPRGLQDRASLVASSGSGVPSVHCSPGPAILAAHSAAVATSRDDPARAVPAPVCPLDPRSDTVVRATPRGPRWMVEWLLRWILRHSPWCGMASLAQLTCFPTHYMCRRWRATPPSTPRWPCVRR